MQHYLSPEYTHEKLDSRDTSDYVDVFEDTWRQYILEPSRWLLEKPNGDVAASRCGGLGYASESAAATPSGCLG
jgi:hypothetical protein